MQDISHGTACAIDRGVDQWLTSGGDERIILNSQGLNRYGHGLHAHQETIFLSSTTASTISSRGRAAAESFYRLASSDLGSGHEIDCYEYHASQLRQLILESLAIHGPRPDVILAPSGTDAHLLAAMLLSGCAGRPTVFLTVEGTETGSGVPLAVTGHRHSRLSVSATAIAQGSVIFADPPCFHVQIAARDTEGQPRHENEVAQDLSRHVSEFTGLGHHVVIVVTDLSKTGLVSPSLQTVFELRDRWPGRFDILIDACQFRITTETLGRYLAMQCIVMLTGSKFVGGPAFSGALLLPDDMGSKFADILIPQGVGDYSLRSDWPDHFRNRASLPCRSNFGMLTRWHAALAEIQALHQIPAGMIQQRLASFHSVAQRLIQQEPLFELLECPAIDRKALGAPLSWDAERSIVPFLIRDSNGKFMSRKRMSAIHENLQTPDRAGRVIKLGQPVACGHRDGNAISALRLSLSAAQIVDLHTNGSSDDILADQISYALSRALDDLHSLDLTA